MYDYISGMWVCLGIGEIPPSNAFGGIKVLYTVLGVLL